MATRGAAYDSPLYQARWGVTQEAGGTATTSYAKFIAFTALQVYTATLTVAVIGTAGTSTWAIGKVGTSGTTTYQLYTLATGVVGTGTQYLLSTGVGGITLNPNEYMQIISGGDATAKLAVGYEVSVQNQANVTI